jgi:DNA-binding MarR family transcriptional regulator
MPADEGDLGVAGIGRPGSRGSSSSAPIAAPQRRLRIQELAARVVLTRTRVSRLVDAGLVERQPDPDDGRAGFAVLTPAGRDALRAAAPAYRGRNTAVMSSGHTTAISRALLSIQLPGADMAG